MTKFYTDRSSLSQRCRKLHLQGKSMKQCFEILINYLFKIGELTPVQAVLHVVDKLGEHKLFMVNAGDSYNVQALLILIVLSLLLQ